MPSGPGTDLLDRVAALSALQVALEDAEGGTGRIVLVTGEAGIGKTTLARRFVDDLPTDVVAFTGACDDLVTPRPYGPVHDIARRVGGELAALLRQGAAPETVHEALLDLPARLPPPVVLVVEDLHWADEATLDAVTFLGRRVERRPLLLVLTLRDGQAGVTHPLTRTLANLPADRVTTVALGPLSREAVGHLAEGRAVDAERLHRLTGGNPFYVTEILAAAGDELPPTVTFAVTGRLAQLPGATRDLLGGLALVPSGVDVRVVEVVEPGWRPIIVPAETAGMVELRDGRLTFRHELARLAVARQVPRSLARGWHARILAATTQVGGDPAVLVHHAQGAGDDDAVARWAPAAAEAAHRVEAHREAAAHYERALAREDRLEPGRAGQLWLELAQVRMAVDRPEAEALEAAGRAVTLARQTGDEAALGRALAAMSRVASWAGDNRLAASLAEEGVELLRASANPAETARAMVAAAYVALARWDVERAASWAREAVTTATEAGDGRTAALARAYLGVVDVTTRGDDAGVEEGVASALALGDRRAALEGLMTAATAFAFRRTHDRALGYLERALELATAYEYASWGVYLRILRAQVRVETGDWSGADEDLASTFGELTTRAWTRAAGLVVRGRLAARRGAPGAGEDLREAWELVRGYGDLQLCLPAAVGLAELAWLEDRLDAAPPELREVRALPGADRWPAVRGELGVWFHRAGEDPGELEGMARPYRLVIERRYREAAEAWRTLGCVYEAADAAILTEDPIVIADGLAVLDGLGATPLARRARGRLRAMGERVPRGPTPETRRHPAGLTPRQAEVLELLAEGATNAQIAERLVLSVRTVDHHVAAILQRLGVVSRQEAARRATATREPSV